MTHFAPFTEWIQILWSATAGRTNDPLRIAHIRDAAAALRDEPDRALADRVRSLKELVQSGIKITSPQVISPGFALVIEAARRTLGIEYYDVQILAGLALVRGHIAEMATGEGKTFAAAFPACLQALAGNGVHVLTVNSYLADRDRTLMAPLYRQLGFTLGLLHSGATPDEKRAAYRCDITYGPGYEFGFDYLRDQMALTNVPKPRLGESFRNLMRNRLNPCQEPIQPDRAFAIVDEADSVMIDEATTPLVLSGSAAGSALNTLTYHAARQTAAQLRTGLDFVVDRSDRSVRLTDQGFHRASAKVDPTAMAGLDRPWPCYVEQALYAAIFLERGVNYVVRNGKVVLVDEFTGRLFADRSLREGLHQAVEAKEDLPITAEMQPLSRISRQRFFKLYRGICGMTGTALGSEKEFREVYGLPVKPIATRLPLRRVELPTRYFNSESAKFAAICGEVQRMHATGRPVLVGSRTIEASERLAAMLREQDLGVRLLNGTQDEDEADIVAAAGQPNTITIATNMAGRGTDIKLGPGVAALGGLHVIGTERHESARVDRQLAGRAARQGDPGSTQFFVSADDSLITRFAPELSDRMRQTAGPAGEIDADLAADISRIQQQAERQAYEKRQQLTRYDRWQEQVLASLAAERPRAVVD